MFGFNIFRITLLSAVQLQALLNLLKFILKRSRRNAHGNMLQIPHLTAMNWDFQDQLKSTEKTDETTYYVYSGGQRVRKVAVNISGATDKIKYERIYLGTSELGKKHVELNFTPTKQYLSFYITSKVLSGSAPFPDTMEFYIDNIVITDGSEKLVSNNRVYSYGFNGMLRDDQVSGSGNSYSTEFRQYDPRLGRWKSLDPVTHAQFSPYSAFDNNPIFYRDPKGADSEGIKNFLVGLRIKVGELKSKIRGSIKKKFNKLWNKGIEYERKKNMILDEGLDINPNDKGSDMGQPAEGEPNYDDTPNPDKNYSPRRKEEPNSAERDSVDYGVFTPSGDTSWFRTHRGGSGWRKLKRDEVMDDNKKTRPFNWVP